MLFANPLFLAALSALAIPVIIHLYNFRRYRKVWFTNVRFIAEIRQESKKRSQVKHLLILLMRLLAITAIVIAFAQPFIPSKMQKNYLAGRQYVSVYIDNSFSMEALATNGKLLDVARNKAKEIASAYKPSDLFQLLTADFEGRHQRFVSKDEFTNLVDEVAISPVFRRMPDVILRQEELLNARQGANRSAYIISDFQKSSTDIARMKSDPGVSLFFVPVAAEKSTNLFIDTAWFDSPSWQSGQAVKLHVKIRNNSPENLEKIPVRLTINNTQKAVASFSVEASGATTVTLPFTNNDAGIQYGTLQITDYPITWDDKFYFSYSIARAIPVLCINGDRENPFLDALFLGDSAILLKNVPAGQIDYSSFVRYPLIILNSLTDISTGLSGELGKFIRAGGNLLVLPAGRIDAASYNTFLGSLGQPLYAGIDTTRQMVAELNAQSGIFADVFEKNASGKIVLPENMDFPTVFRHYIIRGTTHSGYEDILKLQNGDHYIMTSAVEKGKLFLSAAPFEDSWTNFAKHSLFVPVVYRIAIMSEAAPSLYNYIGTDEPVKIMNDTMPDKEVYKIRKLDSGYEFIPEIRSAGGVLNLIPHDQVREAGLYSVSEDGRILSGLAYNYDRQESELDCFTPDELSNGLKQAGIRNFAVMQSKKLPIAKEIHEMSQGTPLWKLFVILALVFMAGEIAVIRLVRE